MRQIVTDFFPSNTLPETFFGMILYIDQDFHISRTTGFPPNPIAHSSHNTHELLSLIN